ncbi:signal peptide protein [Acinetobacter baumannii]|nr:signal peptide protein [Acinetobacter baumannii]EXA94376.1 metA-pathway of phenol degradation family protein [Acinetobacter baumannii 1267820]EXB84709.1 metA-pathway of phenol degradation family protein [Acinetobacter baumannii 299505]EXC67173.1 metA-pathway of phenol degradation family protein [Acinetobacter baumannii 1043794]EXD85416.1 metA-pathway of phenol degradation family protein [Acinetobacter baumannii 972082]EXE95158.1 metA-pathway of phenol degradation family protein [Acinetobact
MSVLALSMSAITGTIYAEDQVQQTQVELSNQSTDAGVEVNSLAAEATNSSSVGTDVGTQASEAPSTENVPENNSGANQAANALQKKEGDATQETNLQEVFTSNERQYSLIKKGVISSYYDLDYTYYRDTRIDLALADNSSQLNRLRVEEDANHTLTNSFTFQYGVLDNLTLSATLPFVAKSEIIRDTTTAGLGDISLGARWEPFPLKQGRLPLVLFGSVSTKTGDSPYEIGLDELSTGKGYYSVGVGASTRKYIDPVVLFASASANYGFKESGLNQARGSRTLTSFDPGISGGFSFGFAYSFNYDVSLTMSYQQSFNMDAEFQFNNGDSYKSPDQSSAMLSFALGVRVSPETIVNGTVGIGLTEDAPDISLGLSFPLDILGFNKKQK